MRNTKNALTLFLILLLAFLYTWVFFIKPQKIGYVDSGKLLSGYKAMVTARAEFEKKQSVWKSNIDTLTKEVQDAIAKYEKTAISGSGSEKQLAKEFINSKQKQLYDYQTAVQQNAQQEEQKLTQTVLTTVNSYLSRYGKKHGYQLILIAANGNLAYADPDLDITDKIVEALNKEYAVTK